jgi:hypothetical protein
LTAAQKAEARRRRAQGATLAELARSHGVGKSTISRLTLDFASAIAKQPHGWQSIPQSQADRVRKSKTARRRIFTYRPRRRLNETFAEFSRMGVIRLRSNCARAA